MYHCNYDCTTHLIRLCKFYYLLSENSYLLLLTYLLYSRGRDSFKSKEYLHDVPSQHAKNAKNAKY